MKKKELITTIKRFILIFIVFILGFLSLKIITYALPNGRINVNVSKSVPILKEEGTYRKPFAGSNIQLDNYTDALILNTAMNRGMKKDESVLKKAVLDSHYSKSDATQINNLYEMTQNWKIRNNIEYSRYWHGIQIVIRPLLLFFTYSQIRIIFLIITFVLLLLVFNLLTNNLGYKYALALLISLLFMNININPMSIQFSAMTILCLISLLIVNYMYINKKNNYIYELFFIIGLLTAFFDLLTFPLITLGLPLINCLIYELKDKKFTLSKQLKFIVINSILWGLSYALAHFSKWIFASILCRKNMISVAIHQFLWRSNIGYEKLDKLTVISNNFHYYFIDIAIIIVILAIITWLILFKYRKNIINMIPILLIGIFPYMWYLVLSQHSYIHTFFTNKIQAITMFSILTALAITNEFDLKKYHKSKKKSR